MVHQLFGRAPSFTFVSVEDGKITGAEVVENAYSGAAGGAGVQCAQLAIQKGASAVLSGRFGPHAYETLKAAGVEMIAAGNIPVADAVMRYLNGTLKPLETPATARNPDHGRQRHGAGHSQ